MKNHKLLGIIAFAAVVALSLAFTACPADETEYTYLFTNSSTYKLLVFTPGAEPGSFPLAGKVGATPGASVEVKKTGQLKGFTWNIEEMDTSQSNTFVKWSQAGFNIIFTDK